MVKFTCHELMDGIMVEAITCNWQRFMSAVSAFSPFVCDVLCILLSVVFAWSMIVVVVGLIKPAKRHPRAKTRRRFVVLVCARNEESVIRLPVKSVLMSNYPADCREVIVLADNCTDGTAAVARAAGATVWEKTVPSSGKGDVLAWGIERLMKRGGFDAIAVFDADNIVSDGFFDAMNDAFEDGETVVTGRRQSSNAKANMISGWYAVYWDVMNELSNRVRTNLGLSGKLTGTGYAFLPSVLPDGKWETLTMVEDVEFTVKVNLCGHRVAYVPEADYADEQPVTVRHMWRQLRRWSTGGWQVVRRYFMPWIKGLMCSPSLRQLLRHIDGDVCRVRPALQRIGYRRQGVLRHCRPIGCKVLRVGVCVCFRHELDHRLGGSRALPTEAPAQGEGGRRIPRILARPLLFGAVHHAVSDARVEADSAPWRQAEWGLEGVLSR